MRRPAAVVLSVVAVLAVGCSSGEAEWEESVHELAALDFFGFEGGAQSNAIDCAEVGYDADVALERVAADTKAANDSLASSGPEVLTPPLVDRAERQVRSPTTLPIRRS